MKQFRQNIGVRGAKGKSFFYALSPYVGFGFCLFKFPVGLFILHNIAMALGDRRLERMENLAAVFIFLYKYPVFLKRLIFSAPLCINI